jgi:four helix bundle protein
VKLDHERLEVYQLARELRRGLVALTAGVRRGNGEVLDQLNRAALSVKLNIAEGSGEFSPKEKVRFYRIARRSACECAALMDDLEDLDLVGPGETKPCRVLVFRIVSALIRLIQSAERAGVSERKRSSESPTPARARARSLAP